MEIFYKLIVLVLVILAFVFAYRDDNLSGVKDAWMYKTCVALTIAREYCLWFNYFVCGRDNMTAMQVINFILLASMVIMSALVMFILFVARRN